MITKDEEFKLLMKACHELAIKDELICSCLHLFPESINVEFIESFSVIFMKHRRMLMKHIFKAHNFTIDRQAIILTLKEMK